MFSNDQVDMFKKSASGKFKVNDLDPSPPSTSTATGDRALIVDRHMPKVHIVRSKSRQSLNDIKIDSVEMKRLRGDDLEDEDYHSSEYDDKEDGNSSSMSNRDRRNIECCNNPEMKKFRRFMLNIGAFTVGALVLLAVQHLNISPQSVVENMKVLENSTMSL